MFKPQGDRVGLLKKETFGNVRKKALRIQPLRLTSNSDTVFTIDYYDIESGTTHAILWGSADTIQYAYRNRQFNFQTNEFYSNKLKQSISNWNSKQLLDVTRQQSHADTFFVQRISINGRECALEQLKIKAPIFD